jgi:flagellar biosynthesis/type III secretory pathway protein FliH
MHATPWSLDEFVAHDVFMVPTSAAANVPAPLSAAELAAQEAAAQQALEAQAYARGFAEGEMAARETLDAELQGALMALSSAMESLEQNEQRWVSNAEANIAALAVVIAKHIVQREIAVDPSFVTVLVSQALMNYPMDQEVTIRLHPEDLVACRSALEAQWATTGRTMRWMADASVQRGGCLTEGRERIIDGRVDTALERAYRNLSGVQA